MVAEQRPVYVTGEIPGGSVTGALLRELEGIVGKRFVISSPEELIVYEYDASIDRPRPHAVVLPETTEQVSAVVKAARRFDVPVIPRGAGTGISGGSLAAVGGVVVALTRMKKIVEIDSENRIAVVEPGVVNLDLSKAAAPYGLFYAPDPSSQRACTIGGNVAEN